MIGTSIFRSRDTESQHERLVLACRLIKNGYEPVPVLGREKKPLLKEWQCPNGEAVTPERVCRQMITHPNHMSIGLLTRRLPSIDLDLHDDEHNHILWKVVEEYLGPTPLRRRGSKGMMLVYRLAEGPTALPKKVLRTRRTESKAKTLVELFGQGGQFVGYGVHPATDRPYRWLEAGMEPATVPTKDLPAVHPTNLLELHDALRIVLTDFGYDVDSTTQPETPAGGLREAQTGPQPSWSTGASGELDGAGASASGAAEACAGDITQLFLDLVRCHPYRQRSSGYMDLQHCPCCVHDDHKAGFRVIAGGGFVFHCHHASCEYNDTTGWQPGGYPGRRVKDLYATLGGNPDDLTAYSKKLHDQQLYERNRKALDRMYSDMVRGDF